VWFEVARLREELGRPADAAFAYASVPAGDANRVEALYSAARLREKLKQPALALRNYQQLVAARPASNPMRLRGLLRLGLIYELKGKPAKAMPLYAEILRLAPHDGKDYDAARRRVEALNSKRLVTLR
jgi:tetratricopeptide (TPR) repeat protein